MMLTQLIYLNMFENSYITDQAIMKLTNLTSLNIEYNECITIDSLKNLINLTSLDFEGSKISLEEWQDLSRSFQC